MNEGSWNTSIVNSNFMGRSEPIFISDNSSKCTKPIWVCCLSLLSLLYYTIFSFFCRGKKARWRGRAAAEAGNPIMGMAPGEHPGVGEGPGGPAAAGDAGGEAAVGQQRRVPALVPGLRRRVRDHVEVSLLCLPLRRRVVSDSLHLLSGHHCRALVRPWSRWARQTLQLISLPRNAFQSLEPTNHV